MNNPWDTQSSRPISGNKMPINGQCLCISPCLQAILCPLLGYFCQSFYGRLKKDQYPFVDVHGKIVVNWIISLIIYAAICAVLVFFVIGLIGFAILGALSIIFPIVGGIKASQGEVWEYPLTIKLIR